MVATISNEKNVRNQVLTLLDKVTGFGLIMLTTTLFFVFHIYAYMPVLRRQKYIEGKDMWLKKSRFTSHGLAYFLLILIFCVSTGISDYLHHC